MDRPPPIPPRDVAALYEVHAELVWKALHRLGVRTADVPDLLQEVFVVLHRRRGELDNRPVEPLLWGIAAGLARNYRRRAFRRLEVLGDEGDRSELSEGSNPEEALAQRRRRAAGERALEALDPEKRAVFVMFELESMSGHEIASLLGVPLGTVHSRLFAARRALSAALHEHNRGEESAPSPQGDRHE